MKLLTDDENFREHLMGIEELKLCNTAKEYIPTQIKRHTLKESAEYLSEFILDNFNEATIDLKATDEVQEKQVKSFIDNLSRGMINSFYHNYMESYGVIEDLMILNEHNRLELFHNLTNRPIEYLELINREILN
jgi:DNA-binding ferritin-like protein (Dps family)